MLLIICIIDIFLLISIYISFDIIDILTLIILLIFFWFEPIPVFQLFHSGKKPLSFFCKSFTVPFVDLSAHQQRQISSDL